MPPATPTTATVTVTVANDSAEPTVAITSPAAGTVAGNVTVAAAASDDVAVVGVQFALDGVAARRGGYGGAVRSELELGSRGQRRARLTAVARDAAGYSRPRRPSA